MAGEVTEVLCFEPGERPVFCLTFTNGEKLVVKSEIRTGSGHADQSIPLAGAMMGQVSPTWIRREKRYPSGFQGSESVDLGQDLMSRLLDEL
jgi:hypothetical protein